VRWKSLWCIDREFSYKSISEKILKIGPHSKKLFSNIKWHTGTVFETQCTSIPLIQSAIDRMLQRELHLLDSKLVAKEILVFVRRSSSHF